MEKKEYFKNYYINHKQQMDEYSKEWKSRHKKETIEMVNKSRRKRVENLRAEGVTNAWCVINGATPKYKGAKNDNN